MIWRIWVVLGIVVVVGAWVLMVPLSPPPMSDAETAVEGYRERGMVPKAGGLVVSQELGHDVFEVPPTDAEERARIVAAMGAAPAADHTEDEGHGEDVTHAEAKGHGEEDAHVEDRVHADDEDHEIRIDDDDAVEEEHEIRLDDDNPEDVATLAESEVAPSPRGHGHGAGGVDVGVSILAEGPAEEVAPTLGRLNVDRTVEIEMREWGYSPDHIMVEPGEVIRLMVRNVGRLPHEFMLMDGIGMQAVDYRLDRADWTLLEHQAIYEVPIVMPGRSFEMVVKIHKPGMWMYMCMFPYHMKLGMMGMFMTAGVSMEGMGAHAPPSSAEDHYEGVGVVISVAPEEGRMVVDHEAIEGYMGAMEMSYMVTPVTLLEGIEPGDKVRFTIDPQKRMIVGVTVE
jgi:uncharacterized cupredoxin-like copper-binding protein